MAKKKPTIEPFRPPPISEAEVSQQVREAAQMLGLKLERQNTGGLKVAGRYVAFGEQGDPDYRATLPGGRRLGLEIKRPGQRPTPGQMAKLRALNEEGAVGLWVDDSIKFLLWMREILWGARVEIDEWGEVHIIPARKPSGGGAA